MNRVKAKGACIGLGVIMVCGATAGAAAASATGAEKTLVVTFRYSAIDIAAQRASEPSIPASQMRGSAKYGAAPAAVSPAAARTFLRLTQQGFSAEKKTVLTAHSGLQVIRDYPALPVIIVKAGSSAAAALAADPHVLSVTPEQTYQALTQPASPTSPQAHAIAAAKADLSLINDTGPLAEGDRGQGTAVAVLDDGTDYKKSAFGKCSSPGVANCHILLYQDFAAPPAKGLSFSGHGTNVAAQVLKDAPDTALLIGNVFEKTGTSAEAPDSNILAAINWIITEDPTIAAGYSLRAVNLSLGDSSHNTSTCDGSDLAGAFSSLLGLGIQPVVAAGNNAYVGGTYTDGVASPACVSGALPVGAVYDQDVGSRSWGTSPGCTDSTTAADQIACFSQGGSLVGILAPGILEKAAGITDSGTSQATPLVSGAIAAIASRDAGASTSSIVSDIESTGYPVVDHRTGQTTPRLDVGAAVSGLTGGVVIKSGNVGLGVTQWGDLNVPGQVASTQGTTEYGLRYLPTGNEFAGPGCPCEGWGVADSASGADGYADESTGTAGLQLMAFTHTATTATSKVEAGSAFDVVNAYSPVKGVRDIYKDRVTITNITRATLGDVVYRRLVDWDMEPTAFDEYVTIEGSGNSKNLLATTDDGFDSADPLSASDNLGATGNFVRYGPLDQGAQFDFDFKSLAQHHSITFTEYYGAAASQAQAYSDLASIKARAYSLGEPSSSADGTPNTAILAFTGIGGRALTYPPSP